MEWESYSALDKKQLDNNKYSNLLKKDIKFALETQKEIMSKINKLFNALIKNNNEPIERNYNNKIKNLEFNKNYYRTEIKNETCNHYNNTSNDCEVCENMSKIIELSWDQLYISSDHLLRLLCIKTGESSKVCTIFIKTVIKNLINMGRDLTTNSLLCQVITSSTGLTCPMCKQMLYKTVQITHRFANIIEILNNACGNSVTCNRNVDTMVNQLKAFMHSSENLDQHVDFYCKFWFKCKE
ncbi:hypothetical protein Mgra_00009679 [Meloidogyne graminicola]|uniref:Uncharacterized protein n=1 Tax=Meloidogyne graminicola TaxID=189291 RepID=A0A8S9ZBX4_9BILA|nr:hypothetical protein Mgra_00009679 [Meloidogyne graminicola]